MVHILALYKGGSQSHAETTKYCTTITLLVETARASSRHVTLISTRDYTMKGATSGAFYQDLDAVESVSGESALQIFAAAYRGTTARIRVIYWYLRVIGNFLKIVDCSLDSIAW